MQELIKQKDELIKLRDTQMDEITAVRQYYRHSIHAQTYST